MDLVKFSFDLSRIAVESMTSLLKSVEPQKVRSFLYFYYLLQSFNFLSQIYFKMIDPSQSEFLLQDIQLKLQFLGKSIITFVSKNAKLIPQSFQLSFRVPERRRRRSHDSTCLWSLRIVIGIRFKAFNSGHYAHTSSFDVSSGRPVVADGGIKIICTLCEPVHQFYLQFLFDSLENGPGELISPSSNIESRFILLINIISMSIRFEEHLLNLDVGLKEVFIKSQSYSKLSFKIKSDDKTVSLRSEKYLLQNYHCLIYEHCEIQFTTDYDTTTQTYTPKQVTIVVFFQQEGENSVGGSVKFNPFQARFQEKEWELGLQNSLPESRIVFSSRLELVSKKQRLPKSKQSFAEDPYNTMKSKKQEKDSKKYSKKSSNNELISPDSKIKSKQTYLSPKTQEKEKPLNKTKKIESAKSTRMQKNWSPRGTNAKITEQTVQKQKINQELQKLKKRIQEERAEKVRSISKLKMEINPKLLAGDSIHADTDIGKLKEKIRNLQRKQKNLQIALDDVTKELERGKQKQIYLEKRKDELERALGEKDIKLKSANNTIRSLNEQIQHFGSRERIVSKKGEVKETIFKDHTKRLEERLKEAEMELIEAINEKNESIKRIGEIQKKNQMMLKEKDAKLTEEKNKNLKLREQWANNQKQLELRIQQLTQQNEDITKINLLTEERVHELSISILRYDNDMAEMRQNLKKAKENCNKLEEVKEKNQREEFSASKRKYTELNGEHMVTKQKLKKYEIECKEYENRIKTLEEMLKAKSAENQKHLARLNNFQRQLDSSKQENTRKGTQIDYMKATIDKLNEKIADFKSKVEMEKSRREESNFSLQKSVSIFKQQKQSLQAEISEYKWNLLRNSDTISQLQLKIKSISDELMKCNEENMAKSQRVLTLEENCKILVLQNDRLEKQRQTSALKIREGIELCKQKQSQLEDERKARQKAEQKSEEQKQRANQIELTVKNRQVQDEKKQKQKEEQIKARALELENIQLQLFKKSEQLLTLKSTNELILRQIQMVKADYDGVKGELNMLQAERTSLKDELSALKEKLEQTLTELTTVKEKSIMDNKKIETLKSQFEQYQSGVRNSFQNLVNQFFKEDLGLNVIATTLIPFPDEAVSSLQIKLVQKRNNFIVKQKTMIADQEHQISSLESQLKDLKILYENREAELKKNETEERDKLKGLMYQGMLEKINLTEQLNSVNLQKDDMLRQIQKLKRQIITEEENQQELNGQLQLLLLEHDSLKAENQDMNNIIFKYREEEIRLRAQFDERNAQLQEEHSKRQQKLKTENIEKDKKIIELEKQIMNLTQKKKKTQEELNKLRDQYQTATDNIKQAQNKIVSIQAENTRLNNSIKHQQKIQIQNKDTIEKLQAEIKKCQLKEETLNSNISNIQTDLMQAAVEKEKLNGEVGHLRERLEQTQRVLSEKGDILKEKMEKKMEQNSQLKSKLIEKQSQLSMKQFYLKQKQQQLTSLTADKQEQKETIASLKTKIKEQNEQKQAQNAKIKEYNKEIERLELQLRKTEDLLTKSNYAIIGLEAEIDSLQLLEPHLKQKEQQCLQLREQKAQADQNYMWEINKNQETISMLKKEVQAQRYHHKNLKEEQKITIQRSESHNTEKYNVLLSELEKQRDEFEKRAEEIQQHNKAVVAQLQARIQSIRQELADSKECQKLLQEEVSKRQADYNQLKKKAKEAQRSLQQIKQKYNRYYLLYQQSRMEIEHLIRSNQDKIKKLMQQSKSSHVRAVNQKLSELSRKIQQFKYSEDILTKNDQVTKKQISTISNRIFGKIRQFILMAEEKETNDSFEVSKEKQSYAY